MKGLWRAGVCAWVCCLAVFISLDFCAQTSPNYSNEEHVLNCGATPAPTLSSSNYQVTLSSIGDGLSTATMSSSSYEISGGFDAVFPPPGEVENVHFTSKTDMAWNPEPSVGTYNVYKASLADLQGGSSGTCFASGLASPTASDTATPSAGQCFYYLVTAENRLNEEGTLGSQSGGTPRPAASSCP
ncbi:MAG: hypothetical protein P8Z49_11750 [Acidobacteriota bacterium]